MIQYKTDRINMEWNGNLVTKKLVNLMTMINLYSEMEFNKSIIITDLIRHQDEQNHIYRNNVKFQQKPWKSTHQFGRAADIRSSIYTTDEIEKMVSFANMVTYDTSRPNKNTCLAHTVGSGFHIHSQTLS